MRYVKEVLVLFLLVFQSMRCCASSHQFVYTHLASATDTNMTASMVFKGVVSLHDAGATNRQVHISFKSIEIKIANVEKNGLLPYDANISLSESNSIRMIEMDVVRGKSSNDLVLTDQYRNAYLILDMLSLNGQPLNSVETFVKSDQMQMEVRKPVVISTADYGEIPEKEFRTAVPPNTYCIIPDIRRDFIRLENIYMHPHGNVDFFTKEWDGKSDYTNYALYIEACAKSKNEMYKGTQDGPLGKWLMDPENFATYYSYEFRLLD